MNHQVFSLDIDRFIISVVIKLSMLDKYEEFFKVSRNEECSLYTGISRETGQHVLLKRFKKPKLSWDEVLKSRGLYFTQKSKIFPKMVEIFKNKGQYYIVYDRPTGPALSNADLFGPLSLQNFYPLLSDLCCFLQQLREFNPTAWVLPEWVFIHRNSVKLLHFQPFFGSKDNQSSDHVYLYKMDNSSSSPNDEQSDGSGMPLDKKKNLIFNLGTICFYLLTGSKKPELNTEDEYLNYFGQLEMNAQKRILKITKDKSLSQMVGKMLTSNVFQLPDFEKITNFFTTKAAEVTPSVKRKGHTTNIQIELQKITLETSRQGEDVEARRRMRPCCAEKEASIEKINEENRQMRQRKDSARRQHLHNMRQSTVIESTPQKRTVTLPSIHKKTHVRMKTTGDLMNTTNSKPLMFANRSSIMKCN